MSIQIFLLFFGYFFLVLDVRLRCLYVVLASQQTRILLSVYALFVHIVEVPEAKANNSSVEHFKTKNVAVLKSSGHKKLGWGFLSMVFLTCYQLFICFML